MLLYTLPQQVHTINKVKWNQTKVRRPIRAATVSKAYCYPTAWGHTGYHSLGPNGQRAAQKEIDSKNWTAECRKFKWQFVVQCLILFSSYVWSAHHFSIISKLLVWCSNDKVLKKTRGQCTARFFLRTLQGYRGGCSWSPNCLGKRMLASFFNPKKDARINSTWEKWWEMPWLLLNAFNCFNCYRRYRQAVIKGRREIKCLKTRNSDRTYFGLRKKSLTDHSIKQPIPCQLLKRLIIHLLRCKNFLSSDVNWKT